MASYLEACGISMGDRLLGAGIGNELGHFEDMEFLEFHKDLLRENKTDMYGCQRQLVVPGVYRDRALSILNRRNSKYNLWGWKEPRTTLFLPFWFQLDQNVKFIFLYRDPYEVTKSLYRRMKLKYLFLQPWKAPLSWIRYNGALIDFVENYSRMADCAVVSLSGFIANPEDGRSKLSHWLGVELNVPFADFYRPQHMNRRSSGWRERLIRAYMWLVKATLDRRFQSMYKQLEQLAEIPSSAVGKGT